MGLSPSQNPSNARSSDKHIPLITVPVSCSPGAPTHPVTEPGQVAVEPGEQGAALLGHVPGHLPAGFPEQLQLRPQDGHSHGTVVGQAVLQPPARESWMRAGLDHGTTQSTWARSCHHGDGGQLQ